MKERRKHQRYSCISEGRLESGEKEVFRPIKLARVINISRNGLAMRSAEHFAPGTTLTMVLNRGKDQAGPIDVRVLHATEQPDGTWIMGCEFSSELDAEDVAFIVAE